MALGAPVSDDGGQASDEAGPVAYSWIVFALSFGLLISDYMARQVLNAVFPLLKAEWSLSDAQLGLLSGVVAVMVGVLTLPLSLLADRWGRIRSLTVMAITWSLATLLCAVATTYPWMLAGRALVGIGEAAYGSVGIAVVISVFPRRMRATLAAAFMAGGLFGQVLGVALGGQIAAVHGWRWAFAGIGVFGLVLGVLYPLIVRERRVSQMANASLAPGAVGAIPPLRKLISSSSVRLAYIGSGLQLVAAGALPAWLPTYFGRYYDLPIDRAGQLAAVLLLLCGLGMILCGALADRLAKDQPRRKIDLAAAYSVATAVSLAIAFQLPPGTAQLVMLGIAMFLVAGTTGPAGAMVANLTPLAIHGSAFATLTLVNNLIGLGPGPILTGWAADEIGLLGAFQLLAIPCLTAAIVFGLMSRTYVRDLHHAG